MFGSIETFLFNNNVSQGLMDLLVGEGNLFGSAKNALGADKLGGIVEKTTKIFDFDLSAAEVSSKFSIEFQPVNDDVQPIHREK